MFGLHKGLDLIGFSEAVVFLLRQVRCFVLVYFVVYLFQVFDVVGRQLFLCERVEVFVVDGGEGGGEEVGDERISG